MQFTVQEISLDIGQNHSASMQKTDEILLRLSDHTAHTQALQSVTKDLSEKVATFGSSLPSALASSRPLSYLTIDSSEDPTEKV